MGADAEVFIFDYKAYVQEAVPAFYQILLEGRLPDWLEPVLQRREMFSQQKSFSHLWQRADLLKYCTYLAEDLAWDGKYESVSFYEAEWSERTCKSLDCSERNTCPLHQNGSVDLAEMLLWLFEAAVSLKCLGEGQFVGRSMTPIRYWETLAKLGVSQSDPLRELLAALGKRGFVIGYQWASSAEGINGWLDPQETVLLAERLQALPLPQYEVSFEAIRGFLKPNDTFPGLYEKLGLMHYVCPGFSFEELSLSFVRTVAVMAVEQNKGLLWGSDMPSPEFILNYPD